MNIKDLILSKMGAKAAQTSAPEKRVLNYIEKELLLTRVDIKTWKTAQAMFTATESPKTYPLQIILAEACNDALLTAQMDNRKLQVLSSEFVLKNDTGDVDTEQTALLKGYPATRQLTGAMLDADNFAYSLLELVLFNTADGKLSVRAELLPRTNVVPQKGYFYPDYTDDIKFIKYRELKEYGTWVLEFRSEGLPLGRLNKAVSHVVFRKFALSCWSELCEIYGIPPRVMKTNTGDKASLNRANKMMKEQGAAAYFIIDETENIEFAEGVTTNGEVYKSLYNTSGNEICNLFAGGVFGQDRDNGTRSKDEAGHKMLYELIKSDIEMVETDWNNIALPALVNIGLIKPGLTFEFFPSENIDKLWERTSDALQYYTLDPEWVKAKFGLEITGERNANAKNNAEQLKTKPGFFD